MKKLPYKLILLSMLILVSCSKETTNDVNSEIANLLDQINSDSTDTYAVVTLGKKYQFNNEPEKAIKLLAEYKKKYPDNFEIAIWHANAESILAGKLENVKDKVKWSQKALSDMDKTVQKFSDNWFVHYIRGINSLQWPDMFRRKPVAVKDFEFLVELHELKPDSYPEDYLPQIYYSLAEIYFELDIKKEEAKKHLDLVISKFPTSEYSEKSLTLKKQYD